MDSEVEGAHKLPDLSPIKFENLWAWTEQQLVDREGINNTDDLQSRLMAIRDMMACRFSRR